MYLVSIPDRDLSWFQQTSQVFYPFKLKVSIPDRDLSWFQHLLLLRRLLDALFQSLIGIWVDFNFTSCFNGTQNYWVSIPDRDLSWFQPHFTYIGESRCGFQSLIGIWVDFNFLKISIWFLLWVSIPDRDLSWFQLILFLWAKN